MHSFYLEQSHLHGFHSALLKKLKRVVIYSIVEAELDMSNQVNLSKSHSYIYLTFWVRDVIYKGYILVKRMDVPQESLRTNVPQDLPDAMVYFGICAYIRLISGLDYS